MTTPRVHDMRDEAQKRAQAVKNVAESAAALVKENLSSEIDQRVMAVIQQRSAEEAYDKGHAAGRALGKAEGRHMHIVYALAIAIVFTGIGALATRGAYEGGVWFGSTVVKAESQQDQLNNELEEKMKQ